MNWEHMAGMAQLTATMMMVGVIWVVQLCIYPRFADLDPEKFTGAHLRHCMGIGILVAPLMGIELLTAISLVFVGWGGIAQWGVLALTLGTWISTGLIQAPCHTRLMKGFDEAQCASLTRGNWIRTVLWTLKGILILAVVGA